PCKPLNKTAEEIQFSGSLWTVLKSGALISGSNDGGDRRHELHSSVIARSAQEMCVGGNTTKQSSKPNIISSTASKENPANQATRNWL
ncbi:MAG: hypothetical protein FWE69_08265, partial [Clostridiales bacterium]|nr:hypothetical protein [Clostridiales bacterium]